MGLPKSSGASSLASFAKGTSSGPATNPQSLNPDPFRVALENAELLSPVAVEVDEAEVPDTLDDNSFFKAARRAAICSLIGRGEPFEGTPSSWFSSELFGDREVTPRVLGVRGGTGGRGAGGGARGTRETGLVRVVSFEVEGPKNPFDLCERKVVDEDFDASAGDLRGGTD